MKILIGWLSDPWVHLLGIGALIIAIGAGMSTAGSASPAESGQTFCDTCFKAHDESRPCYEALTARVVDEATR